MISDQNYIAQHILVFTIILVYCSVLFRIKRCFYRRNGCVDQENCQT